MNCLRAFHSEGVVNKHTPGKFILREFDHHRQIIRTTTFDGAADAQLTGRMLANDPSCLPRTLNVGRDRAHAVRTNLRTPLGSDPEMQRIRWQLIDKPNSLAKLLQYHARARNAHCFCERAVIKVDGEQGGGLKTIVKNYSFAKQRFESEDTPALRIACTLVANMLFLTSEADDPNRKKEERENAAEILTVFNAEDLTLFGLETDLAALGTEFLRFFDVKSLDPSFLPRPPARSTDFLLRRSAHTSSRPCTVSCLLRTPASRTVLDGIGPALLLELATSAGAGHFRTPR